MLIALTGLKQSGKSTVSKILKEKYGFYPINFKDSLIQEMKEFLPDFLEKEAEFYKCTIDELFEKKPGNFRQLMQNFGTELRRGQDKDYWCNLWLSKYKSCLFDVVVDDCRFLNEAFTVQQNGGVIVKIIKNNQLNNDLHLSETESSQIIPDYEITCDEGNLSCLEQNVDNLVEKLKTNGMIKP